MVGIKTRMAVFFVVVLGVAALCAFVVSREWNERRGEVKRNCLIGRFVDWRKVALCLLSVAALNLQAGDVTVGVWIPTVPLHTSLSWTSGDGSKTNVLTDADLAPRMDNFGQLRMAEGAVGCCSWWQRP